MFFFVAVSLTVACTSLTGCDGRVNDLERLNNSMLGGLSSRTLNSLVCRNFNFSFFKKRGKKSFGKVIFGLHLDFIPKTQIFIDK